MAESFTIALAQLNPKVGDLQANAAALASAWHEAKAAGAALLVAPELYLSGYPPEDLAQNSAFVAACRAQAVELARLTADEAGPALLFGAPWRVERQDAQAWPEHDHPASRLPEGTLVNAAILADGGEIQTIRAKATLPNYGVFDEKRVFTPGELPGPVQVRGVRLGVMICEDMWETEVSECLAETGAELLVVLNGSPWSPAKLDGRMQRALARVDETGLPLIYVNQWGGQDELVFDGRSFVLLPDRSVAVMGAYMRASLCCTVWQRAPDGWVCTPHAPEDADRPALELLYQALCVGLRDYVDKNGFPGVVLGLSGGIDSALCAVIAADALGAERVRCVMMPSPWTSEASQQDAALLADTLGVRWQVLAIGPVMEAYDQALAAVESGPGDGLAAENIQARIRGMLLMAISNRHGEMVLATGNKSEMAVGYSTLYGDLCGGYAVLKDVYKTQVQALAEYVCRDGERIPLRVRTRAPSAELRPGQEDTDNLPPYGRLDAMLEWLIEHDGAPGDWPGADSAESREEIARVWKMLVGSEYKRRQGPPGPKVSERILSRERRWPITNGWTG